MSKSLYRGMKMNLKRMSIYQLTTSLLCVFEKVLNVDIRLINTGMECRIIPDKRILTQFLLLGFFFQSFQPSHLNLQQQSDFAPFSLVQLSSLIDSPVRFSFVFPGFCLCVFSLLKKGAELCGPIRA